MSIKPGSQSKLGIVQGAIGVEKLAERKSADDLRRDVIVFDYDGTLTMEDGVFPDVAKQALIEIKERDLAMLGIVSGRDLAFLTRVDNQVSEVFSFLVAENGSVCYFKDTGEKIMRGTKWTLEARKVFADPPFPILFFEIMASTRSVHYREIEEMLHKSDLESKVVLNKDSVMVLPPNVDKGTGVSSAVSHYSQTKSVKLTCFGDGENDLALFGPADVGVAVSNAVEPLKKIADAVTSKSGGYGVAEYIVSNFLTRSVEK